MFVNHYEYKKRGKRSRFCCPKKYCKGEKNIILRWHFLARKKRSNYWRKRFGWTWRKNVPKLAQKVNYTKPPPNSDGKTPLKLRQTPSKLHVRNRDFVDFEQFSIAYFVENTRFIVYLRVLAQFLHFRCRKLIELTYKSSRILPKTSCYRPHSLFPVLR